MNPSQVNSVWKQQLHRCLHASDFTVSPRGMKVQELISAQYRVPMPAFIDLEKRKVNVSFMFAEAAWILSGSNRVSEITPYMKRYGDFSDDKVFMRGGYGPKVIDQLGYVVDSIASDVDTRQAVLTIWRERPGKSLDIPCTVSMQFIVRESKLNCVVYMRSQDIVLGFTYDVFTFSMIAQAVLLLLRDRSIIVSPGDLYLTAGSLHIYETHYNDAELWLPSYERDLAIEAIVKRVINTSETYEQLVENLKKEANNAKTI